MAARRWRRPWWRAAHGRRYMHPESPLALVQAWVLPAHGDKRLPGWAEQHELARPTPCTPAMAAAVRVGMESPPTWGRCGETQMEPRRSSSVPWACSPSPCACSSSYTAAAPGHEGQVEDQCRWRAGQPYLRGCSHITAAVELLPLLPGRPPPPSGHLPHVPSTARSADGSGQPPLRGIYAYGM